MPTQSPPTTSAGGLQFDVENLHQLMHALRQLVAQFQQMENEDPSDERAGASLAELKRLNQEFCAWSAEANRRLRQCEAQLRAGNRREAVRLAEMSPALLDVCAEIMSLGDDDRLYWEELVVANGQPRPEPLLAVVEELSREYGDRDSEVQQLLDELHVMVLARAPLSARLGILWQLVHHRPGYAQDVPVWERARLEQMDDEAKAAAALPDPQAMLEKLRCLVVELVAPEWTSEEDRRRRLVEALERRIAAMEGRVRQRQNDEAAQRQAQNLESLARQIIEVRQAGDARRLVSLVDPWNALLRFGSRSLAPETLQAVEEALRWLEGEQARLHGEQELETRRAAHMKRVADWELMVAEFTSALDAKAPMSSLNQRYQRLMALGAELGRMLPPALEQAYQERRRRVRFAFWRGCVLAAVVAGFGLVTAAGGTYYVNSHARDAEWQDCVATIRGATDEFQRQADAFVPIPTAPVPDTDRLAQSYSGFQSALDSARRLADSSDREGEIKAASAAYAKASSSLEGRVVAFLAALDGGLDNAEQNLNDDDLDNARGILEQKSQQVAKLAGLEPLLPAVANRLSQLRDKCAALSRRLQMEELKLLLPAKLNKLSTIYAGDDVADRVHDYADALREFAEQVPGDSRAEDFYRAAQEESLWVEAFQQKAFAVGWLRKRGSGAAPWRCETNWRPTPGTKYSLHVALPAESGSSRRLARIGDMEGTRPALDGSLPKEIWLQGRLVFAMKSGN